MRHFIKFCRQLRGVELAYPDFIPVLVVHLQTAEVVLKWHNEAVAGNELLGNGTGQVCPLTESHHRSEGLPVVLITEWALVQGLLRALEVWH